MDRKAAEIGALANENETQQDKDQEEQVVNPWEVSAKGGKIDYDKLIDKFGCQRLDPSLIDRGSVSPPAAPTSSSAAASSLPTGTPTSTSQFYL